MSFRIALGALGLVLMAGMARGDTTAPVTPMPLPALVQRYLAWRGGAAFVLAKNLHASGDAKAYGLTGSFDVWQTPDHWRTQFDLGQVKVVNVVTPAQSWTVTPSGQVVTDPDGYKYASRDPESEPALTGKAGDQVRVLGLESLAGRTWEVVRISYGDADTYDDFFDPETGELGAMRAVEKGQSRTEFYSDWRLVGPIRMPFTTRIEEKDLGEQTLDATRYEIDQSIDPALFRQPDAVRVAQFAGGASSTSWIPITGLDVGRIYLNVTVAGKPVGAILDSGATSSIVDKSLASPGAAEGAIPVPGENGVGTGEITQGVDLGLGALTLKGLTVGVYDLAAINKPAGETWRAVLGDEMFNETVVDLDFPGSRIAFHDPAGYQPPPGAIAVPLTRDGDAHLIPLSIEDGPAAGFVMDTGYIGEMRISPDLAKTQRLLDGRLSTRVTLSAIGGDADADLITLKSLRIGGVTLTGVPAHVSETWPSASFTTGEKGLLGLQVLKRFRVIVDWPADKLWLVPGPDARQPFPHDRLGLTLRADGAAADVTGVYANSPAAKAGFREGQVIDQIDGAPAAAKLEVGYEAAGTPVTLRLRAPAKVPGPVRVVVLKDYY
jgi:predicted aspartyl protease